MLNQASSIILIVGGLNWGILGAFKINVIEMILQSSGALLSIVYILVGLAALYEIAKRLKSS